ncbi:MAG: hypothetical protein IJF34_09985 [Clostridia bacterium]|nr:hypothetical protein [Clostridia bacterium]
MKHTFQRITALALVLLLTASLLTSCFESQSAISRDPYVARTIDLGLTEDEMLMDIAETKEGFRATVGVTYDGIEAEYGSNGTPYLTEYRYYDTDYREIPEMREATVAPYQVTACADPALDLVLGGVPKEKTEGVYEGVQYTVFLDGQPVSELSVPWELSYTDGDANRYGAMGYVMQCGDAIYTGIRFGNDSIYDAWYVYVNGYNISINYGDIGDPQYTLCGFMDLGGKPYALVKLVETEVDAQVVNVIREIGRLVPLTPKMAELPMEGIDLDVIPTGGAFSDGETGYFFCETELWRTDGTNCEKLIDLLPFGVSIISELRAVRLLSDGRILVAADGKLFELTESSVAGHTGETAGQKPALTIGVINDSGAIGNITLAAAKYQSDQVTLTVKQYRDKSKLNLAILSGEVDIIATDDLFLLRNYVKQELLAPLEEVSPELFEEGVLIENVVDATRIDGLCYYLPRRINVEGEGIDARFLESGQMFETRKEYCDFLAQDELNFLASTRKPDVLMWLAQDIDEWIDWEANTARFDGEEFKALLELCGKAATEEEIDIFYSTPQKQYHSFLILQDTLQSNQFSSVDDAMAYLESFPEEQRDSKWCWVYFPLPSSVYDGYAISGSPFYAVVNRDESREAAGDFLRWHFMDDVDGFTDHVSFSINREEVDRYFRRNIDGVEQLEIDPSLPVHVQNALEEMNETLNMKGGVKQYVQTWELIQKADHFNYFRNAVYDVMHEEANRYFRGEISLDQAADYIQNRVSIFLAEQG